MAELRILEAAARELARLDRQTAIRVVQRIRWLADNFGSIRPERLTGELSDLFKLRIGDYRVIYEVIPGEPTLVIHAIGHRREVYRQR